MKPSILSKNTPPSGVREVFNHIAESGDVISFALGEPDFHTPAPVIEAACEAYRGGKTHYTPNAGLYVLRSAIAALYEDCVPEQVVVAAGATGAILLTLLTLLNPGDEVIIAEPYWPTYLGQINASGAIPRFVRTRKEDGFILRAEQVEAAITSKTRMILINSPSNPTGVMIPPDELKQLAELAVRHDLMVLSDEVYRNIVYEGEFTSIFTMPGMAERCVIIDSFSKSYAMTGWRIGYAVAPINIAEAMTNMHEYTVSCIPAPTQIAALKALEVGQPYVKAMRDEFALRRKLVVEGISGIDRLKCVNPTAAFYLYFDIEDTGMNSRDFIYRLLDEKQVALAPGTAFGSGQEQYIRLSYANSQKAIREGIERIEEFVHKL